MDNKEVSSRDKSLSLSKIDEDYVAGLACDGWQRSVNQKQNYLDRQNTFENAWRDLTSTERRGPWADSANFKSKLILKYGKATHARLWQLFANPSGFYQVQARTEAFKDKENNVKQFMDFIIESFANGKQGCRKEFDTWLWDVVMGGNGYLKCFWKRELHEYEEVVQMLEVTEKITFDKDLLTGVPLTEKKITEKEEVKTEYLETPQVRRIVKEDVSMPTGWSDPQEAPWVQHRVYMSENDLKAKANSGMFYKDAVEELLDTNPDKKFEQDDQTSDIKRSKALLDGVDLDFLDFTDGEHAVLEWYGRAYVDSEVDVDEFKDDLDKLPQEIVVWVAKTTRKVLGWTYLHRISPGGIRPIFRGDFVSFPDRDSGVGTAELIYEEQRYQEAIINMRLDNGMLASLPMFAYRQSSGLKAQSLRVEPGQGIPVDDINDIKMLQLPFLQGFGYQEEAMMENKAEGILALSDIQLGRAPEKVGALRTASGSNLLSQGSDIQLEIHFDRVSRCINKVLQFLFRLCRERMPHEMYYRVTGERGEPIFGKVNRDDLKGDFDFKISVDLLGQSQLEKQQQAVLMMQTLINPSFLQTSVVTPENLYNLCKNFLKAHKMGRVDDYITKPQGYTDRITPAERIYRLSYGLYENPPIETTVRLDEDHQAALDAYQAFTDSDLFGLLDSQAIAALHRLQQAHASLMQAQQAGAAPNISGMQVPRDGFQGLNSNGPGGGELASLMPQQGGGPTGPVV